METCSSGSVGGTRRITVGFLLCAGLLAAIRHAEAQSTQLPEGPGRVLVLATCVQCHDLEPIVSSRRSAAEWRHSIAQMIQLGVNLLGDEIELLTQYLTDSFGPDTPVPDRD